LMLLSLGELTPGRIVEQRTTVKATNLFEAG